MMKYRLSKVARSEKKWLALKSEKSWLKIALAGFFLMHVSQMSFFSLKKTKQNPTQAILIPPNVDMLYQKEHRL